MPDSRSFAALAAETFQRKSCWRSESRLSALSFISSLYAAYNSSRPIPRAAALFHYFFGNFWLISAFSAAVSGNPSTQAFALGAFFRATPSAIDPAAIFSSPAGSFST